MIFSAGYNLNYSLYTASFSKLVCSYNDILEVFFPFPNEPSGRPPIIINDKNDFALKTFIDDLTYIKNNGKKLNLLLNGNCYGQNAISNILLQHIDDILYFLKEHNCYPEIITTTSIHIAKYIKNKYNNIELRASVTFDIHELQGIKYLADFFDGYYLSLSKQRDIAYVKKINDWCILNNKKLCLLPNSSCIGNCPFIAYHANLVAHDTIKQNNNINDNIPCMHIWNKYGASESLKGVWIRPEDICHYENICYLMKLTTRMHENPKKIFDAYISKKYDGNLFELLDPYYPAFNSLYLDNNKFPDNWFEITSKCNHNCINCKYCENIFNNICYTIK